MNRLKFNSAEADTDEQKLADFVVSVSFLLKSLTHDDDCGDYTYNEMRPRLKNLYQEVHSIAESYALSLTTLPTRSVRSALNDHGLIGNQLELKLDAVDFIAHRFYRYHADHNIPMARHWLRRLLDVVNRLFKSLLGAVPGGEVLEEYKSITEALIPDPDEHDLPISDPPSVG